jgi:PncC family amidohydrolase
MMVENIFKKFIIKAMLVEQKVAEHLLRQGKKLAIAESCTGGLLSQRLTSIAGSSAYFQAGIVAYSNLAKSKILNIPSRIMQTHGTVSSVVAEKMATAVRELFQSDFGISITGIAGPTGGTKTKPLGLTYIAISTKKEILCIESVFPGDRNSIRKQASTQALKLLLEFL